QYPHRLPLRGVQGRLPPRLRKGPQGLHHLPFQPGGLPGCTGEGKGSGKYHLSIQARGRQPGRTQGQRAGGIRRRDAHRRQSFRRPQRRLLREILIMTVKLDKKIVSYKVLTPEVKAENEQKAKTAAQEKLDRAVQKMDENIDRPETLHGTTYKIKTPLTDHALYITINDIVLNPGTAHEQRRPFDVFINSKNMDHFQWVVALTRVLSAVFRKGGHCTFLVEEMKAVFDPKGGYFKKGGKFMPSLV